MKCIQFAICSLAISLLYAAPAYAATTTAFGNITTYSSGWTASNVRVILSGDFMNPDNCSMVDGYITDPNDQGNALFNSILLSALMANRQVRVTISGCYLDRPHIIGVDVL
jgi:hypothetical protein